MCTMAVHFSATYIEVFTWEFYTKIILQMQLHIDNWVSPGRIMYYAAHLRPWSGWHKLSSFNIMHHQSQFKRLSKKTMMETQCSWKWACCYNIFLLSQTLVGQWPRAQSSLREWVSQIKLQCSDWGCRS